MIETNAKLYGDLKSILVTREEIDEAVDTLKMILRNAKK